MRPTYFTRVKSCSNDQLLLLSLFANVGVLTTIDTELDRRATQDLSCDFYMHKIVGRNVIGRAIPIPVSMS